MSSFSEAVAAACIVLAACIGTAAEAATPIRIERVDLADGAGSRVLEGQLHGDTTVDYVVRAAAGQALSVTLRGSNPQNYFNVTPPDSDASMFIGNVSGDHYQGVLPADGEYTIRVYLMRAAARRNESSQYALEIDLTGKALPPLAESADAVIPGTIYHASASVTCKSPFATEAQDCEAFVIRRGFDGTGTVEIHSRDGVKRRILFVAGTPVASDSPDPIGMTRTNDVSSVRLGSDERYEIPDVLVSGD